MDDFAKAAKTGVRTSDGRKIISQHLKAMKQELSVIARREEKKTREAEEEAITMPFHSAPKTQLGTPTAPPAKKKREGTSSQRDVPTGSTSASHVSSSSTQHIKNPPMATTKRRPQEIANKNPLDLAAKKQSKCGWCKESGHTQRKCKDRLKTLGYKPA